MSVRDLAIGLMLSGDAGAYPVERDGRIIGSITPSDVAGVRPDLRSETPLFEAMRPIEESAVVSDTASLAEVAAGMRSRREDRVFVRHEEELVGILTLQDVSRWIERTRELGLDPRELAAPSPNGDGPAAGSPDG
jgi:CBS domain-containing protein